MSYAWSNFNGTCQNLDSGKVHVHQGHIKVLNIKPSYDIQAKAKLAIANRLFYLLPLKTRVAQRACISEMGMMAPRGWMRPITARVGFSRPGGNTCLYSDVLFPVTDIT